MRGTFVISVILPVLLFPQLGSSRPNSIDFMRPKRSLPSGSSWTYDQKGAIPKIETLYLRPKRSTHTDIRPKLIDPNDLQQYRQKRSEERINEIIENQHERSRPKRSRFSDLNREKLLWMNTLSSDVKSRLIERTEAEIQLHKKRFLSNTASLNQSTESTVGRRV